MKQRNLTILVLEDERPLQMAIKSKLETENFNVVTAKSSNQALDYLKEGIKIDGIWLDHYLYGKESGLDFLIKLRKNKSRKDLPVFIVSNTVSKEKLQLYFNLDVQKCYTKVDYRLDEIIADIRKILGEG